MRTEPCRTGFLKPHLHLKRGSEWVKRAKFSRCRVHYVAKTGERDWEEVSPCGIPACTAGAGDRL